MHDIGSLRRSGDQPRASVVQFSAVPQFVQKAMSSGMGVAQLEHERACVCGADADGEPVRSSPDCTHHCSPVSPVVLDSRGAIGGGGSGTAEGGGGRGAGGGINGAEAVAGVDGLAGAASSPPHEVQNRLKSSFEARHD
jgi:hypothetical protein